MKRIRIAGLCLVATFAMTVGAAATASAASARVAKPSGYIVLTSGFQIRSTSSAASLATSAFQVRGYDPKSSEGANWVGLTKIDTTTLRARRFANRTSDT